MAIMTVRDYWTLPAQGKNTILRHIQPLIDFPMNECGDFFCPYCKGTGLFPTGNAGIVHKLGCPAAIATRFGAYLPESETRT